MNNLSAAAETTAILPVSFNDNGKLWFYLSILASASNCQQVSPFTHISDRSTINKIFTHVLNIALTRAQSCKHACRAADNEVIGFG